MNAALTAQEVIATQLMPQLLTLSLEERKETPKIGDKTVAFVQRCVDYAELYPERVPRFIDPVALEADFPTSESLRRVTQQWRPILEAIEGSQVAAGLEASLLLYRSVCTAKPPSARNPRNGTNAKTIPTEAGPIRLGVPRDRAGYACCWAIRRRGSSLPSSRRARPTKRPSM